MARPIINKDNSYRQTQALSYSALSLYCTDRKKFHRKYVLWEEDKDKSEALTLGSLVDVLLTDATNFDNYFVKATAPIPTPQLLNFCELLIAAEQEFPKSTFTDYLQLAYDKLKESNGGKLGSTFETLVTNFTSKAKQYYDELKEAKNKELISLAEFELAKNIVASYNKCEAFKAQGDIVMYKFPIFFELLDDKFKSELDIIEINTREKIIYPKDIKTSSFIEDFVWSGYIKRKYWIQAALYTYAVNIWKMTTPYKDYKVAPFVFNVVDSNNYYEPLQYVCPDNFYNCGFEGFYIGNKYHEGIFDIIKNINLSKKVNRWGISPYNLENKNIVKIPIFSQEKSDY